jgi:hypothetical protein
VTSVRWQTAQIGSVECRRYWPSLTKTSTYVAHYNLALVALSFGDYDGAAPLLEEGVTLSEQIGDRANVAYCLEGLAVVANAQGDAERCARLIGAAQGLHESVGVPVYAYYEPTDHHTRARWPPYAPKWVRRPSRRRGLRDGR